MKTDEEIVERVIEGEKEYFEKIVERYKAYVFAIILNFVSENEEAENIVQEVFLQIYISLPKYKNDNFKAWLGRIASNKAIDYKRQKINRERENEIKLDEKVEVIEDNREKTLPEEILINREKNKRIDRIVERLPDKYRLAIEKFYFEEKSYEEICMEEDIEKRTLETRLYRGRKIIRERWLEDETL